MFGYLRFFLAFLVLISHIGVKFYGLNPGVMAVVVFYILAGFVVSHIYMDILHTKRYKIVSFYKDRFLRIFPLYLYISGLTIIFLLLTSFGEPRFTILALVKNLTIIPLNFYMYIDSTILTKTNPPWWLIPPAWSLGTELQAYLLLPLVFASKKLKIAMVSLSFFIYLIANLSILNPDYFGYRFIIGVFFIFAIGSSMQQKRYIYPLSVWLFVLIATPFFYITDSFSPTYTKETFIGLFFGIPLVYIFSNSKIKLPLNSLLGSLSYGVFLSHFLSIWILEYMGYMPNRHGGYIATLFSLSLAISLFGVKTVEKYAYNLRYKVKKQ